MEQMAATPHILALMSVISDPTRARTLRLLERQELAVAELCDVLQLPQSTVSRHLKVLSDEGWIGSRREATSRLYRMSSEGLDAPARRLWALVREQLGQAETARHDDRRLERILAARRAGSQAFFATTAGQWDRLRDELFGRAFDLRALAGLADERWVVGDLGCGTGGIAETLAPFVGRVIAVDSSAAMLKAARRRLSQLDNVELRRGEMEALPIDDRSLDAALITLVLHHLAEPRRALEEAARVLRPGGKLLVIDMQPHDRTDYRAQMGHVWLGFSEEQMIRWLSECGLTHLLWRPLPPEPGAKGPSLFAATARLAAGAPT